MNKKRKTRGSMKLAGNTKEEEIMNRETLKTKAQNMLNRHGIKRLGKDWRTKLIRVSGTLGIFLLLGLGIFGQMGWLPTTNPETGARTGWFGAKISKTSESSNWNPFAESEPQTNLQLSKEYIYAGSRLLAIEEAGGGSGSPTPTPTPPPSLWDAATLPSAVTVNSDNTLSLSAAPGWAIMYSKEKLTVPGDSIVFPFKTSWFNNVTEPGKRYYWTNINVKDVTTAVVHTFSPALSEGEEIKVEKLSDGTLQFSRGSSVIYTTTETWGDVSFGLQTGQSSGTSAQLVFSSDPPSLSLWDPATLPSQVTANADNTLSLSGAPGWAIIYSKLKLLSAGDSIVFPYKSGWYNDVIGGGKRYYWASSNIKDETTTTVHTFSPALAAGDEIKVEKLSSGKLQFSRGSTIIYTTTETWGDVPFGLQTGQSSGTSAQLVFSQN